MMLTFFLIDLLSSRPKHSQTIFTLGILGTFVGIALGLWNFDTKNIEDSIPQLLAGLKTAFFTSIFGMVFVVIIGLFKGREKKSSQNQIDYNDLKKILEICSQDIVKGLKIPIDDVGRKTVDGFEGLHQEINRQSHLIKHSFKSMIKTNVENKDEMKKGFDDVNKQLQKNQIDYNDLKKFLEICNQDIVKGLKIPIDDVGRKTVDGFEGLHQETNRQSHLIKNSFKLMIKTNVESKDEMKKGFDDVNKQLQNISKDVSQGASRAIVEALEKSMKEFNQNLKESFGENFMRLNESCINMIQWQKEYKKQVEDGIKQLNTLTKTLNTTSNTFESILKNSKESIKLSEKTERLIQGCNGHIESMKKLLEEYALLAQDARSMFEVTKSGFKDITTEMTQFTTQLKAEFPNSLHILNERLTDLVKQFSKSFRNLISIGEDKRGDS